jgi:hypothetical protein
VRFAGTQHGRSTFRHSADRPRLSLSLGLVFCSMCITEAVLQNINNKSTARQHNDLRPVRLAGADLFREKSTAT